MSTLQIPPREYQCKQCGAMARLPADVDPHSRTWCGCCTEDHHHGAAAAACSPAQHGGEPCWNPPRVARPDGCYVCRPILHLPQVGEPLQIVAG